uniref:KH-like RNA-binding domain-containing protein n=1 Tax=Sciurus vulgaris TaxID=55149 RepID=A0A8D2DLG5_SCIVU
MVGQAGAAEAAGATGTSAQSLEKLFGLPLPPPRIRVRPWWFPAQELSDPLVFYLDAWVVDSMFGKDRSILSEIERMSQALLRVDTTDTGNLVEITVFGHPGVKNRVKSILLSLATWYRELRDQRAKKIKHLEEFLKARASCPDALQHPVQHNQDCNN